MLAHTVLLDTGEIGAVLSLAVELSLGDPELPTEGIERACVLLNGAATRVGATRVRHLW
jgi:hypothetical protein